MSDASAVPPAGLAPATPSAAAVPTAPALASEPAPALEPAPAPPATAAAPADAAAPAAAAATAAAAPAATAAAPELKYTPEDYLHLFEATFADLGLSSDEFAEYIDELCHKQFPEATVQNERHECAWGACTLVFPDLDLLVQHLLIHHIGNRKPEYRCQWRNCSRQGMYQPLRFALISHLRLHTGEKPSWCFIPECVKSFTRLDALAKHMRTVHGANGGSTIQDAVGPWWWELLQPNGLFPDLLGRLFDGSYPPRLYRMHAYLTGKGLAASADGPSDVLADKDVYAQQVQATQQEYVALRQQLTTGLEIPLEDEIDAMTRVADLRQLEARLRALEVALEQRKRTLAREVTEEHTKKRRLWDAKEAVLGVITTLTAPREQD